MYENIITQVARLQKMALPQLQEEWEREYGESPKTGDRDALWKQLARKIQEDQLPAISDLEAETAEYRAKARGVSPEDWRPEKRKVRTRNIPRSAESRVPPPGTMVTRVFRGQEVAVKVLEDGFEYSGQVYRSLSAIAREVTGTSWNGYTFFGLNKGGRS